MNFSPSRKTRTATTHTQLRGTKLHDPSRHFHAQFLANELVHRHKEYALSLSLLQRCNLNYTAAACLRLSSWISPCGHRTEQESKRKRFAAAGGAGCDVTLSLPDPGNETPATTITHEANIFPGRALRYYILSSVGVSGVARSVGGGGRPKTKVHTPQWAEANALTFKLAALIKAQIDGKIEPDREGGNWIWRRIANMLGLGLDERVEISSAIYYTTVKF
jgi:hypothetical protein